MEVSLGAVGNDLSRHKIWPSNRVRLRPSRGHDPAPRRNLSPPPRLLGEETPTDPRPLVFFIAPSETARENKARGTRSFGKLAVPAKGAKK